MHKLPPKCFKHSDHNIVKLTPISMLYAGDFQYRSTRMLQIERNFREKWEQDWLEVNTTKKYHNIPALWTFAKHSWPHLLYTIFGWWLLVYLDTHLNQSLWCWKAISFLGVQPSLDSFSLLWLLFLWPWNKISCDIIINQVKRLLSQRQKKEIS